MKNHDDFVNFLSKLDLDYYREKYKGYKSVEEDLPKNCQILDFIYKYYWEEKKFLFFDEFINEVIEKLEPNLSFYNLKRNNNDVDSEKNYNLFLKGWIARQYRTWVSILTQIQFGYLYQKLNLNDMVLMSKELDEKGIDIRVVGKKDYGIKKVSKRTDIHSELNEKTGVISIRYSVPKNQDLKSPLKKNGEMKLGVKSFFENGKLDFLPNGFIIFNEKIFEVC